MKFIEEQKKIQYFGIELAIPAVISYIATDASGVVFAYTRRPHLESTVWFSGSGEFIALCKVDLEGMKWEDTLICVE